MNPTTTTVLHTLSLLLAAWSLNAQNTNEIGRYQLFSGPFSFYDSATDGYSAPVQALYRIDTVTGQTWHYERSLVRGTNSPTGTFGDGWAVMSEDSMVSTYIAIALAKGDEAASNFAAKAYAPPNRSIHEAMLMQDWSPKRREEWEQTMLDVAKLEQSLTNSLPRTNGPARSP